MDLYIGSHFLVIFLCKVWPYIQIVSSDLNLTFGEWKESIAANCVVVHWNEILMWFKEILEIRKEKHFSALPEAQQGLWLASFLAVQNSSIGDLVPCSIGRSLGWAPLTIRVFTTLHSDPKRLLTFETNFYSSELKVQEVEFTVLNSFQ